MKLTSRSFVFAVPVAILCGMLARAGAPQAAPKPAESSVPVAAAETQDGVRVAVFWDAKAGVPKRNLGAHAVKSDEELQALLSNAKKDFERLNKPDVVVSIDAAGEVPWNSLIQVVALCRKAGWKRIEFVTP